MLLQNVAKPQWPTDVVEDTTLSTFGTLQDLRRCCYGSYWNSIGMAENIENDQEFGWLRLIFASASMRYATFTFPAALRLHMERRMAWGMVKSTWAKVSQCHLNAKWLPSDCNCVTWKAWKYVACMRPWHWKMWCHSPWPNCWQPDRIWQDLTSETSHFQGRTKPWMLLICTNGSIMLLANTWKLGQISMSSWLMKFPSTHQPSWKMSMSPDRPDRPDLLHGRFHPRKWDELVSVIHIQGQVTSAAKSPWSKMIQDIPRSWKATNDYRIVRK